MCVCCLCHLDWSVWASGVHLLCCSVPSSTPALDMGRLDCRRRQDNSGLLRPTSLTDVCPAEPAVPQALCALETAEQLLPAAPRPAGFTSMM
uniref:Secreted protein n=1 Tax=Knipowitschia caucasica TaxID=637954 RepID=A0AAV2K6Q3_KNICA